MATYYVAKTGNDSNAGTDHGAPKLTIDSAIDAATTSGDIVEIIDEGTYSEDNLTVAANNVTVRHTASGPTRPVLVGQGNNMFNMGNVEDFKLQGLEIHTFNADNIGPVYFNTSQGKGFEMDDCFVHSARIFSYNDFVGTSAKPVTIKNSILFFGVPSAGSSATWPIRSSGYFHIYNCLVTSSDNRTGNDYGASTARGHGLFRGYDNANNTASFSTFIARGHTNASNHGAVVDEWAKVINCIVSGTATPMQAGGTGGERANGIQAISHTYNVVKVRDYDFVDGSRNEESAGTGDQSDSDAVFVDASAIGNTIVVAESFKIEGRSPAVGGGVSFGSITTDLASVTRSNPPDVGAYEYSAIWTDYETEDRFPFDPHCLAINHYVNVKENQKYRIASNPGQSPFSRGVKGPSSIRGRTTPYKVDT